MSWVPDRYRELRSLLRRDRLDDEVDEELSLHLELRAADLERRGLSAAEAWEEARRRFGDLSKYRADTRAIDEDMLREQRRMELFDAVRRELRQGARGLMRSPGFTLVAVVTLALGIGASSAVFTLLKRVVLNPLPYPSSDRLVVLRHQVPGIGGDQEWGLSTGSYFHFRDRSSTLEELAVYASSRLNLRTTGDASLGGVIRATPNLFTLLGAQPVLGRVFREEDGQPEAARVVLLDHAYWQRAFGGRSDVIGTTLTYNGIPAEIVGVLAPGFRVPGMEGDVYVALRLDPAGPHWNSHYLRSIARMRPGVTLDAVQREVSALTPQLVESYPSAYNETFMQEAQFATRVHDLRSTVVGADVASILWVVLGAVAIVLLIAFANVANLFLVRSEVRRNEIAVRSALGADRVHLFVQSFVEALLLCLVAGAAAVWLANAALRLLTALAPDGIPRLYEVGLGSETVITAFALAIACGVALALWPVLRRSLDYGALREAARGLTLSRRRVHVRSALVAGQIALALVLLASAGLMLRTFQRMRAVDLGFDPDNVATLVVALPSAEYGEPSAAARFWEELAQRVQAIPGVQSVGGTIALPLAGDQPCAVLQVDVAPVDPTDLGCPAYNIVTPGYFETAGITVRGRIPTWNDIHAGTGAVVISRALAEMLWPGKDPIGRGVRVPQGGDAFYRIVGVADDVVGMDVRESPPNFIYYPIAPIEGAPLWGAQNALVVIVRTQLDDVGALTRGVRSILREMDPAVALGSVEPWRAIVNRAMATTTFTMVLLGVAGSMALLLAIVGLYGVIAYVVSRRRAEIGVRMALGADRRAIGSMVVLQSMRLAVAGVGVGLVGAAATTGALRTLLWGVTPTDGLTLTAVAILLLGVCTVAAYVPARRAAAVSPMDALRTD